MLSLSLVKAQKDSSEIIRPFQVTFITPMGSNGIQAPKITNRVSLNILAGVSRGVLGFEAAGLANVTLKSVKGVQMAGLANIVLDSVHGAQFSSYVNYSGGNFKGVSAAGLCNVNLGTMHGAQFSAMANFNRKGITGIQVAPYANITLGNLKGTQISAFTNIVKKDVEGTQISAFVNYAKKVKGVQLGFVNIADSIDGVSIGFFNVVKKGLHQVEVSADEMFYANVAYRTGSRSFYNIISAGIKPTGGDNLWHFGYGVGTSVKLKEKLYSELSLSAHHVNTGSFYFGTSELVRLYVGVEYKLAKKVALAAGPCLNLYMSDTYDSDYTKTFSKIPPYSMLNETNTYGFNYKAWLGARVALRFL